MERHHLGEHLDLVVPLVGGGIDRVERGDRRFELTGFPIVLLGDRAQLRTIAKRRVHHAQLATLVRDQLLANLRPEVEPLLFLLGGRRALQQRSDLAVLFGQRLEHAGQALERRLHFLGEARCLSHCFFDLVRHCETPLIRSLGALVVPHRFSAYQLVHRCGGIEMPEHLHHDCVAALPNALRGKPNNEEIDRAVRRHAGGLSRLCRRRRHPARLHQR
ncbi:MAG: hypothetical protein QM723_02580 [Myxococcaceae bacterium]